MQCIHVQRRLSAYLDHETGPDETKRIAEHLRGCAACAAELRLLESAGARVKELTPIHPSADFRARFWERVRNEEAAAAGRKRFWDVLVQRWIPVSVACSALIVVFSAFTAFSPLLYAMPEASRGKVGQLAAKSFTGVAGRNLLGPLNFIEFCDNCQDMICDCCASGNRASCPMMKREK